MTTPGKVDRPGRPAYMPPPERFDPELEQTILLTKAEWLIDWSRKSSLWPLGFGLACCAIEMMSTAMTRFDISRFGAEVFRATPRQADVMIVAGTVTHKMAPRVRRLYDQMGDPKWVIAMGACTVGGGPYFKFGYHVVKGVDKVVPVDIYLPGCPPRPEALLEAIMRLQELVTSRSKRLNGKDPGYTPPEKGSRQAVADGHSPSEPWTTERALQHDDPKREREEETKRKKAEAAAKKKAEAAAKKKAEEEAKAKEEAAAPPDPKPEAQPAAQPEGDAPPAAQPEGDAPPAAQPEGDAPPAAQPEGVAPPAARPEAETKPEPESAGEPETPPASEGEEKPE
jgi:NADH-quinone oxidoreductase subunit B